MSHFRLLCDPDTYRADPWDLLSDNDGRSYWLDLFSRHFETTLTHAAERYGKSATRHIEDARQQFTQSIDTLRTKPDALGDGLSVMALCRHRESVLRDNRLHDPFGHIKRRENENAIELSPDIVRRLHAMAPDDRWLHLVECVFAGNIFDLGSSATMNTAQQSPDFLAVVEETRPRPWLVDDYDRLAADLAQTLPAKWGKAVIFVDNAGCDFILGVMPLARELALVGVQVVLAANELPSLNDITVDETVE
ncbi:MAG: ARMT1-like domain-containing protein, partial [Planctomycetota bacterium]